MPSSATSLFPLKKYSWTSDLFIALSAANLVFFKAWSDLTRSPGASAGPEWSYELRSFSYSTFGGLWLAVFSLATALFIILRLGGKKRKPWPVISHLVVLGFLFFFANGVRLSLGLGYLTSKIGYLRCALIGVAALGGFCWYVAKRPASFVHILRGMLLMMSPFLAVTMLHTIRGFSFITKRSPLPLSQAPYRPIAHKIIWHIFDEFDYRLGFEQRPAGVELPELDRMAKNYFSSTFAEPPGTFTAVSMPSYFTGRYVDRPLYQGKRDALYIGYRGEEDDRRWREQTTLFTELREHGYHAALAGWYLPFCAMLRGTEAKCLREPHYTYFKNPYQTALFPSFLSFWQELSYVRPTRAQFQIKTYRAIRKFVDERLEKQDTDFLFVHWPAPHAPWIYDAKAQKLSEARDKGLDGYFDNLALVDRTLKELREAMQKNDTWDSTTVLVTTDHGWNSSHDYDGKHDERIPFLLKLSGQKQSHVYTKPFNTIVTKDLLMGVADGRINTLQDAVAWIDSARSYRYVDTPIH